MAFRYPNDLEKILEHFEAKLAVHRKEMAKLAEDMRAGRIPYPTAPKETGEPQSPFRPRLGAKLLGRKGRLQ